MRYLRLYLVTLAVLSFGVSHSHAQEKLGFDSPAAQWYEFSLSGGWGLYQSAANNGNPNGGSAYLFDDGPASSGAIRAEIGWGTTQDIVLSFGLWYSRASAQASSGETTPADYQPDPNDDFVFNRSVTHHLTAPYVNGKYFFHRTRSQRYFLSGGMILGIARATFKYNTSGLDSGERSGSRNLGDTRIGIFGSIGFNHALSSVLSLQGEAGYRYFEHMRLDIGDSYTVSPPIGPTALVISDVLRVDYAGPFALIGITLRP